MDKKIKVVWICHVQNPMLRERIPVGVGKVEHLVRKLIHKPEITFCPDVAQWITNGIKAMEEFRDEVELYIVSPGYAMKDELLEFSVNGINYCLYRNEDYEFGTILRNKLLKTQFKSEYKKNRKRIKHYIQKISPDVVHIIGLENQFYSLSFNDIPSNIPTIVQLTALLNDPDFYTRFFMSKEEYEYRASIERDILLRADYIGTVAQKFIKIIYNTIKRDATIINTSLALAEEMNQSDTPKEYDFVYFALNISKAIDLAVDAFIIASKKKPGITLDVIGGCPNELKAKLDEILKKNGLNQQVVFEGKLPTHDDVIAQIRKSKFALLPLKIDLISGTIREAMANGIPVITTDTGEKGTQLLNKDNQAALISQIGDREALANNMLKLLEDRELSDMLRTNGFEKSSNQKTNKEIIRHYVDAYKACLDNYHKGTPIPSDYVTLIK